MSTATDVSTIEHLDYNPIIPCEGSPDCHATAAFIIRGTPHFAHRIAPIQPPLAVCTDCWKIRLEASRACGDADCPCGFRGPMIPGYVAIVEVLR